MGLDSVKIQLNELDRVQRKFSKQGATDTEPDHEIQSVIIRALHGEQGEIWKLSANQLELFIDDPKSNQAATEISLALGRVVSAIRCTIIGEMELVGKYVRDYCWRIH